MIGILIALQVNNWNEWRKDRIRRGHFKRLVKNLEANIQMLNGSIQFHQQWNRSNDIVISVLENKLEYSDSLKLSFDEARMRKMDLLVSKIGYRTYKDKGLDIITNKALSTEIIKLFELILPSAVATHSVYNIDNVDFENHVVQNFIKDGGGLTPNDYKSLFTDHFCSSWVKEYKQ